MSISRGTLQAAFAGKRVLITGHTGFKGTWLTLWLASVGADVTGYALEPNTTPALFDLVSAADDCTHIVADIRDRQRLFDVLRTLEPEFVFHLAAQPLVRKSYQDPLETIDTNILGTANLLEAIRVVGKPTVVVVITSDKCYENRDWEYGYRETEPMGGADVYSMSKGAAELVLSSYRRSFFDPADIAKHGIRLASARAGNVVGGGDWAADRIVPDLARAVMTGEVLTVRNPQSVRPWQHVLEPLGGYLLLAERMAQASDELAMLCEGWNFGPQYEGEKTVQDVVMTLLGEIGKGNWRNGTDSNAPAEAKQLRLSIEKAMSRLHWTPRWDFRETMAKTAEWYKAYFAGSEASLRDLTLRQIDEYMQTSDK